MPISRQLVDRERDKFRGEERDETAVAVHLEKTTVPEGELGIGIPEVFGGSVDVSDDLLVPPLGNSIYQMVINNEIGNAAGLELRISFDGGFASYTLQRGETLSLDHLGDLKQVVLRGNQLVATDFQVIVTRYLE